MKIRRFNEDIESGDFISIQEVKDIFAHLDDYLDNVEISYKWLSGITEYHLTDEPEETQDTQVVLIKGELPYEDNVPFYAEYGYDSQAVSTKDLIKLQSVLAEVIDASKHVESEGYKVHTQITNYMFFITISKIGDLLL